MTKEELIGKLQMVYVGDMNALNEMIGYYDGLKESIEYLKQQNKKQKEVVNKAIEFINECTRDEDDEPDIDIITNLDADEVEKLLDILKEVK